MREDGIGIVHAAETLFFSHHAGRLCQWITVTIENLTGRSAQGTVTIVEDVVTRVDIVPGVREYRCFAPTLWPDHPPIPAAPVQLNVEGRTMTATVSVGTHRPWAVYLLSDVCTDCVWVYD